MTIRARLEARPETLLDLARSSISRFHEGLNLIRRGDSWIGIYLTGYSAEMILKNAFFICRGASFMDPVRPELDATTLTAKVLRVQWKSEAFHSVLFWSELLILGKRRQGCPLEPHVQTELLMHAETLYNHWWVPMRYRRMVPEPGEVRRLVESAAWFMAKRELLWRR